MGQNTALFFPLAAAPLSFAPQHTSRKRQPFGLSEACAKHYACSGFINAFDGLAVGAEKQDNSFALARCQPGTRGHHFIPSHSGQ